MLKTFDQGSSFTDEFIASIGIFMICLSGDSKNMAVLLQSAGCCN